MLKYLTINTKIFVKADILERTNKRANNGVSQGCKNP